MNPTPGRILHVTGPEGKQHVGIVLHGLNFSAPEEPRIRVRVLDDSSAAKDFNMWFKHEQWLLNGDGWYWNWPPRAA